MTTKIAARVLLALGFLAASVSYSSWIVGHTVLDVSATRRATNALITTPQVRKTLAAELQRTLAPKLGSAAAANPKLKAAIRSAVADPRFVGAFDDAVAKIDAAILSDKGGRVTLDTRAVTTALHAAVARQAPALAPRITKLGSVSLPVGSAQVPHIGGATHTVGRVGTLAALIALLLASGALLLVHDAKMVGRIGRRTAMLALGPALLFALAPRLLDAAHSNPAAIAATILRAYGRPVMVSAALLAIAGISTWLIALAIPTIRRRRRPAETPAVPTLSARYDRGRRASSSAEEPTAPLPAKLYL